MHFSAKARQRATLRAAFAGRLAPGRIGELARSPHLLEQPAQNRRMSFLACRIRGFAETAKVLADDPDGLSVIARRVATPLAREVLERSGLIARIAPGVLRAVFNAPFDDPRHAFHACECALAMQQSMEKINRMLEQRAHAGGIAVGPLGLGIGVNTGDAAFGDFGADNHPEFTAAGQAVDWADRLEHLSADYGAAILAGNGTCEMTEKNFAFLEVDLVTDEDNQTEPVFALLGTPLSRANPKFLALKTFHERIFEAARTREWESVRMLIDQARALSGANPVLYDLYLKRIAYYEAHPVALNVGVQRSFEPALS